MKKQILIIFSILSIIFLSLIVLADTTFFENPDDTIIYETPQQVNVGIGAGVSRGVEVNQTALEPIIGGVIKDYFVLLIIISVIFIIFLIFLYKRRKKKNKYIYK